MEIVKLNILDGRGEIPVAVGSLVEAERLRKFMKDATGSFDFQSIWDEREACACVCEDEATLASMQAREGGRAMDDGRAIGAEACAESIRARSNAKLTGLAPEGDKS